MVIVSTEYKTRHGSAKRKYKKREDGRCDTTQEQQKRK